MSDLKAMIVVLVGAMIAFALVKPTFLRFMFKDDFERRRNLWLCLTAAGFLSPNIWIYILFAVPALLFVASKDSNPVSLWLLTFFVVPPIDIPIPTVIINQLFTVSQSRILALFVLLPIAVANLRTNGAPRTTATKVMDALILIYGAYQLALLMPYENVTNTMRRAFLFGLDTWLVYYAFSRSLSDRRRLADAMAAFCLACIVVAPLAVFETVRSWLLFVSIPATWGVPNELAWLMRGDALRSQLATGHAISMGYVMATALAFWLYLKDAAQGTRLRWLVILVLCAAIVVSYARATWVMAAIMPILVFALAPSRPSRVFTSLLVVASIGIALYASPLGSRLLDLLPFVGSGDQQTVVYRQQLAETSWLLIQQNPIFGNPFAYLQMESLRQGQGLIDLVNAYAGIAVFQGLVGLTFYAGSFIISVVAAYFRLLAFRSVDSDLTSMGAALIACMIGTLIFMATVPGAWLIWAVVGMLMGYSRIDIAQPVSQSAPRSSARFGARIAV